MYKNMAWKKKNSQNIFMYNPKKDKALNTLKKKVRNDGTCN